MKNTLILALQLGCLIFIDAQTPSFEWARTCKSVTGRQHAQKVVADKFGSVYLLGFNFRSATFADKQLDSGYFLVKYRHDGEFLWSRSLPGTVRSMEIDQDGYLYIAGNFTGSVVMDQFVHTSSGEQDFFLSRLLGNGTAVWSISFGGAGADQVNDIAVSKDNCVHVAAGVTGPLTVGAFNVKDTGFFIARINHAKTVQWVISKPSYTVPYSADSFVRMHASAARDIAIDNNGITYVIRELPNSYYAPGYALSKYNSAGQELSDKPTWGAFDYPSILSFDSKNNMFLMYNTGSHYTSNIVLGKLDPDLNGLWARGLGNGYCNYAISNGSTLDPDDNITVTGWIGGSGYSSHDSVTIDSTKYAPIGSWDAAVWQFDGKTGNTLWLKRAGGRGADYPASICSDPAGNLILGSTAQHYYREFSNPSADTCFFDQLSLPLSTNKGQYAVAKIRTSDFIFSYDEAGVSEPGIKNQISFFPNPGNGMISWQENIVAGKMRIMDIHGRLVTEQPVSGKEADVSHLKAGFYFIFLEQQSGSTYGPYVKE